MNVKARPELASARLLATWNTGRNYTHNGQRIAVFIFSCCGPALTEIQTQDNNKAITSLFMNISKQKDKYFSSAGCHLAGLCLAL